ncbi:MAG: acyl--CoA ligase [Lachnospiraceae bacterium]|nr:acyl--CoA ligase [Lachnospiraceae bacterium]
MNQQLTGYPSIDKPWLKYYSQEAINAPIPQKTVFESIYEINSKHPDDVSLMYFGRKITYKTVFENVERVKKAFIANGVKKGDRVIMFTSATPELIYATLALCRIGAVANMINPLFTVEQIKDRINETDAEVMLVLDQLYGKIQPILKELCIKKTVVIPVCNEMSGITKIVASVKMKKDIDYSQAVVKWSDFIVSGKSVGDVPDVTYEKDLPLVMVYSSGTTGASKGIVLTNDGINATISHYLSPDFPYNRGDKFLQIIPAWFSTGLVLCILMPICLGITVIMEPVYNNENFAKDIRKYSPNMTLGSTSQWLYALSSGVLDNVDMSKLKYPITGGELILPRVENMINDFLKKCRCESVLLKGYGMCELGSTVSTDSMTVRKKGSTGIPIKGVTIAAFDMITNKELKYDERGEIRVDSPAHMKEYFKNPEATNEYFYKDENGTLWGRTGDIGYVDEEGFVYILGRATDTFKPETGDEEYCFDVESQIYKNEYVAQCEVVGISVGDYDVPVAHIIMEKSCELTEEQLIKDIHNICKANLPEHSVPHGYKIIEAFPIKSSGKRDMELIKQDRAGFIISVGNDIEKVDF